MAMGAFLRFYYLGYQSLWIDESYSALIAERIAETGLPIWESGKIYLRAVPNHYLLGGLYAIFGASETALRMPAAIFIFADLASS